ncbi:MAG: hypothetical protein HYZ57_07410 [Acidobacteria bacterium]|nr:hypothetical protein [Acidobacteriota bacterium]MBI3279651.1 hypothetical protein [Acidobacteriota bacterium]
MKLAPISAGYLRRLLRDSGVPLAALVEGVVQGNFADLERTLLALAAEYMAAADAMRSRQCRDAVITAKDHTRWSLRRQGQPPEAQARREEMLLWMLTWLENPPAFADWLALRKRQLKGG